jgi:hypothetical protein
VARPGFHRLPRRPRSRETTSSRHVIPPSDRRHELMTLQAFASPADRRRKDSADTETSGHGGQEPTRDQPLCGRMRAWYPGPQCMRRRPYGGAVRMRAANRFVTVRSQPDAQRCWRAIPSLTCADVPATANGSPLRTANDSDELVTNEDDEA